MNTEITIVTAFFKINRKCWKGFSRTDNLYFEYFKAWAHIKNKIIVYVESEELKEEILRFRKNIGLENCTIVNIIDDIFQIAPELYKSIYKVSLNPIQKKYRLLPKNPEVWNAEYDYIMLLKMWCVSNAIEKGQASGMVSWIDFGYNHGGAVIDLKSDFNFLWKYEFPEKINLFLIQDIDDKPIFDIVLSMDTYVMGMLIVGPANLWKDFWILMKNCMMELNRCGLIDDDQNIILMAYRKNPTMFNTYKSGWQLPLQQFGGNHLKLRMKKNCTLLYKFAKKIKRIIICLRYSQRIFTHMLHNQIH